MASKGPVAGGGPVAVWQVDLGVAVVLAAVGAVVMLDSLRVGIGWGIEGPEAGFFPFFVGLFLLGGASFTIIRNLVAAKRDGAVFVEAGAFRRVLAVLIPSIVYVAAVGWLGIYLASALLIAAFMRVFGRYGYAFCGAMGVAIAVALYLMFEIWFNVPLPKGPLEAALGL